MKKQYVFITMIAIIFYLSYLILTFTYKEHQINTSIKYIKQLTAEIEEKIDSAKKIIEYKTSKAYKNKILKEQQSYKNLGENVVYFTTEENFNKYTKIEDRVKEEVITTENELEIKIKELSIYEKWMYFLFKKHPFIGQ